MRSPWNERSTSGESGRLKRSSWIRKADNKSRQPWTGRSSAKAPWWARSAFPTRRGSGRHTSVRWLGQKAAGVSGCGGRAIERRRRPGRGDQLPVRARASFQIERASPTHATKGNRRVARKRAAWSAEGQSWMTALTGSQTPGFQKPDYLPPKRSSRSRFPFVTERACASECQRIPI